MWKGVADSSQARCAQYWSLKQTGGMETACVAVREDGICCSANR